MDNSSSRLYLCSSMNFVHYASQSYSSGLSLHAARRVEAHNRAGLEQLCSNVTRPPLASGSLEKVGDDKYLFKLKSSWSDGTSHIILSGHELLEKLASIVPKTYS